MNAQVNVTKYESRIENLMASLDEEVNRMFDRANAIGEEGESFKAMDEYQMGIMDENYRSLMRRLFATALLLDEVRFKLMLKRMDMGMDTDELSKVDESVKRAIEVFVNTSRARMVPKRPTFADYRAANAL